jgi:hemerythrin-like domain-containing protein
MTVLELPPGYDDPLRLIHSAHVRIEQRTALLVELCKHVTASGVDETARKTADAVLRYFEEASVLHHEDEELDLFPKLLESTPPAGRKKVEHTLAKLTEHHKEMHALQAQLRPCLVAMTQGRAVHLDPGLCVRIHDLYVEHIDIEERDIIPLAQKRLSPSAVRALGESMAARRARPV